MVQTRSKGAQSKDDEATSRSRRDEKLSGPLGGTFFKVTTVIALFLSYIAAIYEAPVDVEAATKKYSDFTGTFEPNVLLRQSYQVGKGIYRPETVIIKEGTSDLYTGSEDGWIYKVPNGAVDKGAGAERWAWVGGQPLGLAFDKEGDLVIAEPIKGLIKVDKETKQVTVLTSHESGEDGVPLRFIDDVAVASDGKIYFSVTSKLGPALEEDGHITATETAVMDFLSGVGTGKLCVYDPATRETKTLLQGLYFGNGLTFSRDESYLLVQETFAMRTLRLWLKGEKAFTSDVFVDELPGVPDGVSTDNHGRYWMTLASPPPPLVKVLPHLDKHCPACSVFFRKLLIAIRKYVPVKPVPYGFVAVYSPDGKLIKTFQDPGGVNVTYTTSATYHNKKVFIGSLRASHISVLDVDM